MRHRPHSFGLYGQYSNETNVLTDLRNTLKPRKSEYHKTNRKPLIVNDVGLVIIPPPILGSRDDNQANAHVLICMHCQQKSSNIHILSIYKLRKQLKSTYLRVFAFSMIHSKSDTEPGSSLTINGFRFVL
jgi:hypothetical protein